MSNGLKIGIVGSGISGLTTARVLHPAHDVTIFESTHRVGGHGLTIDVPDVEGNPLRVDAGVCMFYSTGYPNFFRLLRRLSVPTAPSAITVELLCSAADKRYYFDLNAPWKTLASSLLSRDQRDFMEDGYRFYRHVLSAGNSPELSQGTLGEHLDGENYSEAFRIFIAFLCGATWTLNQHGVSELPFSFVARTMWELGFLPTWPHGKWHHIPGSVGRYFDALVEPLRDCVQFGSTVERVERNRQGVTVYYGGKSADFDQVIFAIPPQQALSLIADPTDLEQEVLGAFAGQNHTVVFTSDVDLARSWNKSDTTLFAASNVCDRSQEPGREFLFQIGFANLTKMCGYPTAQPLYMWYQFPEAPWPGCEHTQVHFSTPRFTDDILRAQARHAEVSGRDRLHFCGAGWVNGIHEGGVVSAQRVTRWFGRDLDDIVAAMQ